MTAKGITAFLPTVNTIKMINGKRKSVTESRLPNIFFAYMEIWGNPHLKPYSTYETNLMWTFKSHHTLMAFAEFQPNYSVQLPYQTTDHLAVIMKETNFDYNHTISFRSSKFSMPCTMSP